MLVYQMEEVVMMRMKWSRVQRWWDPILKSWLVEPPWKSVDEALQTKKKKK